MKGFESKLKRKNEQSQLEQSCFSQVRSCLTLFNARMNSTIYQTREVDLSRRSYHSNYKSTLQWRFVSFRWEVPTIDKNDVDNLN